MRFWKREELTEEERRYRRRQFRTRVIYAMTFLSFTGLLVRAAYVQISNGKAFRQAELSIPKARIPVLPQRGWIYDANGQVLAWDKPSLSIVMNRYSTMSDATYQRLAAKLAPVLHQTPQALYSLMKSNQGAIQVTLANNVALAQVAYVVEHQSDLPGVEVIQDYVREYPYGDLAGQVLGYVGAITAENVKRYKGYLYSQKVGETGVEEQYEPLLQGKPGYELVAINSAGNAIAQAGEIAPQNGKNLQLTLDGHEQACAQMIVQSMIQKTSDKNTVENAAAVMLDVKTGGVIAMVSYPYLDPNWFTLGTLSQHAHYASTSGAQVNSAIAMVNYPGSTVKPANLITAMKAGLVSPQTTVQDDGYIYIGKSRKNEDEGFAFGPVDPIKALTVSSDVFFYEVGLWFGKWFGSSATQGGSWPAGDGSYQHYLNTDLARGLNALFQGEADFGLGFKTGIDLPYEEDGRFYILDSEQGNQQVPYDLKASERALARAGEYENHGSPASLADAAIGQSQMFTPLQLAEYALTLANRGVRLTPHVLQAVYEPNGTPTNGARPESTVRPKVAGRVTAAPWQWDLVQRGMVGVTSSSDGTAYGAFAGAPYQVAGKTGTAQIVLGGKPTDNSVFICYAPADHPQVAVAVMAPGGGYGAQFSAVIARQMLDAYFNEHHAPFMPKSGWTDTSIPANWKSSPAYQIPEQSP
ncbi:peptidoglycan D,D-transpeptidase FtsI family protein [Alicyclobacillus vulcanalis]|uniref:Penicillin-binding protein 2 n=1 Tax=Alicyclobacillus vulcanalis TaxID=252246 RepID=A0A1N7JWV0_9BACL|nr:penicillin-binding transpeptidase domain-containing protein [Alicyclobacillus vulcanalis]SIS53825.1 penicillin-binding protein 2 [Alicyclobacillus vulcanalis]